MRDGPEILERFHSADGTEFVIRPLGAHDGARELRFLESLSAQSVYERTFSHRRLQPGELKRLVRYDVRREIAILAALAGTDEIIAVARLHNPSPTPDPRPAPPREFALVVADAWQGRGVGRRLLAKLIELAEAAGIKQLMGHTSSSNRAMQAVARQLGFAVRPDPDDATLTVLSRP